MHRSRKADLPSQDQGCEWGYSRIEITITYFYIHRAYFCLQRSISKIVSFKKAGIFIR